MEYLNGLKYRRDFIEWDENGYVNHFNIHTEQMEQSSDFLPQNATILITSGASCPDASLERVLLKVLAHYSGRDVEDVLKTWEEANSPQG